MFHLWDIQFNSSDCCFCDSHKYLFFQLLTGCDKQRHTWNVTMHRVCLWSLHEWTRSTTSHLQTCERLAHLTKKWTRLEQRLYWDSHVREDCDIRLPCLRLFSQLLTGFKYFLMRRFVSWRNRWAVESWNITMEEKQPREIEDTAWPHVTWDDLTYYLTQPVISVEASQPLWMRWNWFLVWCSPFHGV